MNVEPTFVCGFRTEANKVVCYAHPDAPLIEDYRAGDMICSECGLVVGDRWALCICVATFCEMLSFPSFAVCRNNNKVVELTRVMHWISIFRGRLIIGDNCVIFQLKHRQNVKDHTQPIHSRSACATTSNGMHLM